MTYELYKDHWVKDDFHRAMIRECLTNYNEFSNLKNAVVMDWGMNCGGLGRMLLDKKIKQYIGLEPLDINYDTAVYNFENLENYYLIKKVVTPNATLDNTVTFFMSDYNNIRGSVNKGVRTRAVTHDSIHPDKLIEKYQPSHLKMDIEGSEWDIFQCWKGIIPKCINEVAVEWHGKKKIENFYLKKWRSIIENEFDIVFEKFKRSSWIDAFYRRRI